METIGNDNTPAKEVTALCYSYLNSNDPIVKNLAIDILRPYYDNAIVTNAIIEPDGFTNGIVNAIARGQIEYLRGSPKHAEMKILDRMIDNEKGAQPGTYLCWYRQILLLSL